ncbi:phenylacetic acid degradation operon negative regulatory protein, partial [Sinosporangium album]
MREGPAAVEYEQVWRDLGLRPLKARSIIASALLGVEDSGIGSRRIVQFANLFNVPEGTTRVTLSRMTSAGELKSEGGLYHLDGRLRDRRLRQFSSRTPNLIAWDGAFEMEIVHLERREAVDRLALRAAMTNLNLGEFREGVWTRPGNLDPGRRLEDRALVREQCYAVEARVEGDPREFVGRIWDLDGWRDLANRLRRSMAIVLCDLEVGSVEALAPGFMIAAAVTHHLMADPLLPDELLPARWPGGLLRDDWERFDGMWKSVLREWFEDE